MGQQQLLLVILVTIVVGIATVVAMQVVNIQLEKSNKTKVRQDVQSVASSARAFYRKPGSLDGGNSSFKEVTFRQTSFPKLGLSSDALKVYNENGTYVISSRSNSQFTIEAYPSTNDSYDDENPLASTDGEALTAVVTPDSIAWQ
jgi:Tfp pilus assembly protein PilE